MSFFDQVYDDMSWEEVCYRLPSELAVNAILRRVTNLQTLRMFMESVGTQPSGIKELKNHVNEILSGEEPDDIMKEFPEDKFEKGLFNWMDDTNRKRLRDNDPDGMSMKYLFNSTDSDDRDGMKVVLDRILSEQSINPLHLRATLNKADDVVFASMLDTILKDSRPEVRVQVLSVSGVSNKGMISDLQRTIGLKALAKCATERPTATMSILPIDVFSNLKPLERLTALERYLNYFPSYRKIPAFNPDPTKEEFDMILFAGCIEHNDKVTKLNEKYHLITEADLPQEDDDEDDR